MPSDIRAVLLIPAEGDPLGLLREGVCGARPPVVVRRGHADVISGSLTGATLLAWHAEDWAHDPTRWPECLRALVLAWDGSNVPSGMTPALSSLAAASGCPHAPHLLAWANDLYRRSRAWRIIAFVQAGSVGTRWSSTYVGSAHPYPGTVRVPGLMDIDRHHALSAAMALGLVCQHMGLGTLVLLDAEHREVTP